MGTYPNAVDHYTVMKADNDTTMSFWGISSGGHVGQTVATLYPEVVDKFWFDGELLSRQTLLLSARPTPLI
jgi:hypothetical protein